MDVYNLANLSYDSDTIHHQSGSCIKCTTLATEPVLVIAHEIGHILGLRHVFDPQCNDTHRHAKHTSVMTYERPVTDTTEDLHHIGEYDVASINWLCKQCDEAIDKNTPLPNPPSGGSSDNEGRAMSMLWCYTRWGEHHATAHTHMPARLRCTAEGSDELEKFLNAACQTYNHPSTTVDLWELACRKALAVSHDKVQNNVTRVRPFLTRVLDQFSDGDWGAVQHICDIWTLTVGLHDAILLVHNVAPIDNNKINNRHHDDIHNPTIKSILNGAMDCIENHTGELVATVLMAESASVSSKKLPNVPMSTIGLAARMIHAYRQK